MSGTLKGGGVRSVHLVGCGGIGVSALAEILLGRGYAVSGSDREDSPRLERLAERGATVHVGHAAAHVAGVDLVVASTAIPADNPELAAARAGEIPVIRRGELLAELAAEARCLAVSGTHGKTTVSAMAARILIGAGLDPTVLIGGDSPDLEGNARLGQGEWLVAEADESDGTFLLIDPAVAVITNVDPEHLDYWQTAERYIAAFARWAEQVPVDGRVVLCSDHPVLATLAAQLGPRALSYGLTEEAWLTARDILADAEGTAFTVARDGEELGRLSLQAPGQHSVANGLGALGAALAVGVEPSAALQALDGFQSVARRFQTLGEVAGVLLVDDYAHHPAELQVTLEAARLSHPGRRLVAVFQPHLYSRTRDQLNGFVTALAGADRVLVTEIYAAREAPIDGVSGATIVERLAQRNGPPAVFEAERTAVATHLERLVRRGDLVLFLGAGDIWKSGHELLQRLGAPAAENEAT